MDQFLSAALSGGLIHDVFGALERAARLLARLLAPDSGERPAHVRFKARHVFEATVKDGCHIRFLVSACVGAVLLAYVCKVAQT